MLPSVIKRMKTGNSWWEKKKYGKWKQSKITKYWKVHHFCTVWHLGWSIFSQMFPALFLSILYFKIPLSLPSTTEIWVTWRLIRPAGVKRIAGHASCPKPAHSRYSGEFSTENKETWPFCFEISLALCIFFSSARTLLAKASDNWGNIWQIYLKPFNDLSLFLPSVQLE